MDISYAQATPIRSMFSKRGIARQFRKQKASAIRQDYVALALAPDISAPP